MTVSVSRLRAMGLAKETTNGTPVTTPTRFINGIPPDSFTPMIEPLPSKGIQALRAMYPKITQGPGTLNGMKIKLEVEPDNIGEILQACFGLDTYLAAGNNFIVWAGVNDGIDFNVSATDYHCVIPQGVYTTAGIESAIATAMTAQLSNSWNVTVTSTKIVISGTTSSTIKFGTGTQASHSAALLLGFTAADTTGATSHTAPNVPAYTLGSIHQFIPQNISALPTYTWWFDKALKYPLFAASMLNKFDLTVKAKAIVEADVEFVGRVYDDIDGTSQATTFSKLPPFVWSNAVLNIDGAVKPGYDNFKASLGNQVKADHALSNSIWPYVNYSEGFTPEISAELFFEDTTQYQKFLAGTTAHVNVTLTFVYLGTTYQLIIDIPNWYYKSANLTIPSNGPLKIPFTGMAEYNSALGYDVQMILVNDVTSQY